MTVVLRCCWFRLHIEVWCFYPNKLPNMSRQVSYPVTEHVYAVGSDLFHNDNVPGHRSWRLTECFYEYKYYVKSHTMAFTVTRTEPNWISFGLRWQTVIPSLVYPWEERCFPIAKAFWWLMVGQSFPCLDCLALWTCFEIRSVSIPFLQAQLTLLPLLSSFYSFRNVHMKKKTLTVPEL